MLPSPQQPCGLTPASQFTILQGMSHVMSPKLIANLAFLIYCALLFSPAIVSADGKTDRDSQWEESIAAFAAADRQQAPSPGGVLFVGSSSIRLWSNLETRFGDQPVIKRGFGGSRLSDCARYLDRLVIPYKPRLVLVYAGDNDLAEGKSPQDVLKNFEKLVEEIQAKLPATRVAFISIKPSPARAAFIPLAREANRLISQYVAQGKNLDFIDVFTPMLDADGRPRAELFRADALHLNESGYALWKAIIAPHVR
jgi:lysophospholipase L1-like esterase